LSARGKKTRAKSKKEEVPVESPKESRPTGLAPTAMVSARHERGMITRRGKGFSVGEMSQAKLKVKLASAWGVPTDFRRRSVLEENVASLTGWYTPQAKKTPKPAPVKEPEPEAPAPVKKAPKKRASRKK
jgi:ribosomal protein L13E